MSFTYDSSVPELWLAFIVLAIVIAAIAVKFNDLMATIVAVLVVAATMVGFGFLTYQASDNRRGEFFKAAQDTYGVTFSEKLAREFFKISTSGEDSYGGTKPFVDGPLQGLYTVAGEERSAVFYLKSTGENEYALFVAGASSELTPFEDAEGETLQAAPLN